MKYGLQKKYESRIHATEMKYHRKREEEEGRTKSNKTRNYSNINR